MEYAFDSALAARTRNPPVRQQTERAFGLLVMNGGADAYRRS
jgi:hypothetical protein